MLRFLAPALVIGAFSLAPPTALAQAQPVTHECQKPVVTGVEVYTLKNISVAKACPVALDLFKWEYKTVKNTKSLYGCHGLGKPYLKLKTFEGWTLSLAGKYQEFRMQRGRATFRVTGTDFPLNCT